MKVCFDSQSRIAQYVSLNVQCSLYSTVYVKTQPKTGSLGSTGILATEIMPATARTSVTVNAPATSGIKAKAGMPTTSGTLEVTNVEKNRN
jgi:hypothetical protein